MRSGKYPWDSEAWESDAWESHAWEIALGMTIQAFSLKDHNFGFTIGVHGSFGLLEGKVWSYVL